MNAVRILLLAALAAPFIALIPSGQDPAAAEDWGKHVDKACTSPRYGLRLAAAKKVAAGGGAAVPAIRAYAQTNGRDQLPSALVDAIADDGGDDREVLDLLLEWSGDRDFYWRASALRGVVLRAPRLPEKPGMAVRQVVSSFHDDPAWLMRTHARFGTVLAGDDAPLAMPERDPRVRPRLASLLLQHGKLPPLQPLLDALADERTFQGDPWGQRIASDANKALKAWLGDSYPEIEGGDTAAALIVMNAALEKKSGQKLQLPQVRRDPPTPFAGGIEILSCKHGDLFLQWTDNGAVHHGLDVELAVQLPADVWQRLDTARKALAVPTTMGTVVCDAMRLRWPQPDVHAKAAPQSLPAPVTAWLTQLARAIDEAGQPRLAAALRTGLEQFAAR